MFPLIAFGDVDLVHIRVEFERIEATANDVNEIVVGNRSCVVACAGKCPARAPRIRFWIVDFVPADAGTLLDWV